MGYKRNGRCASECVIYRRKVKKMALVFAVIIVIGKLSVRQCVRMKKECHYIEKLLYVLKDERRRE